MLRTYCLTYGSAAHLHGLLHRESSVDILVTTTSQHETVSTDALEAPVLGEPQAQPKRCSRAKAIFNLSNTVIGAGEW